MRNLILFLLPAITFAQLEINTLNRDYSEALDLTNIIRSYYDYPSLKYSDSLSIIAKEAAIAFLKEEETIGTNTMFYYVDKHQFVLRDTYMRDAVVAWSVDTDLITRQETFTQMINDETTHVGFAIEEKNGFVCVTAKFNK